MSEIIRGENVSITFFDSGSSNYLGFSCARSVTVNLVAEIIGKSTVGSGKWKEKEKVAWDWNFTIEGAMYLNKSGMVGPPEIIDYWQAESPVDMIISMTSEDGDVITYYGSALITNVSATGTVNNAGSMNITGDGTGEFTDVS